MTDEDTMNKSPDTTHGCRNPIRGKPEVLECIGWVRFGVKRCSCRVARIVAVGRDRTDYVSVNFCSL